MLYESQGVFSEGWAFNLGQEDRGITQEHGASQRSKKPKGGRISNCQGCETSFTTTKGTVGKYCSHACMHESRINSMPTWFECSMCFAAIGFGLKKTANMFRSSPGTVDRVWKKKGIKPNIPKDGSWKHYAQNRGSRSRGWWGNKAAEDGWMQQHKEVFPDWSYEWHKEKARRDALTKYSQMSLEEKKVRNKRIQELRKIRYAENPKIKSGYRERIYAWKIRNPEQNKESRIKSIKKRKANDPGFRVQCNLRHRLKEIMRKVKRGGTEHRNNLTGCSTRQLADHLESTFKRGMTWANYGTRWHVDHIIPCAAFDQIDEKQRAQCWHWTNLRALDAKKNMEKSDTITEPQMNLLLCATR